MNNELQELADRLAEASKGEVRYRVRVLNLENHDKRFSGIGTVQGRYEAIWEVDFNQLDLLEREDFRGSIKVTILEQL